MRIIKAPNLRLSLKPEPKKGSVKPGRDIIFPEDIPSANEFGVRQIRPSGSRVPLAECKIIGDIVVSVNDMSTFTST